MQDKRKKETNEDEAIKNLAGFHIEADRIKEGISVSVTGVCSILEFTEEISTLKLRRGRIRISGKGLSIAVYENKIVEISGKVCTVEFL